MQWRRREVNIIKTYLGDKINRLGDGLIRCVRSQDYSQVSGVGSWALINERENTRGRNRFGIVVG